VIVQYDLPVLVSSIETDIRRLRTVFSAPRSERPQHLQVRRFVHC